MAPRKTLRGSYVHNNDDIKLTKSTWTHSGINSKTVLCQNLGGGIEDRLKR